MNKKRPPYVILLFLFCVGFPDYICPQICFVTVYFYTLKKASDAEKIGIQRFFLFDY